jgi:glycosyltransferase involved in cell wall biosynthesis
MPTVLLVTPYLPPHIGGVERYVVSIANELAELDWRVVIATTARKGVVTAQPDDTRVSIRYLRSLARLSNTPVGWRWTSELKRIIKEEKIDVVNAHTPVPGLADAAQHAAGSVPFVLTYHAGAMRKNVAAVNVGLRAYEHFVVPYTVRRSSYLICSSAYVREFLEGFPHNTPVDVIPPGVDTRLFAYAPIDHRKGLLFVGSLDRAARYKALDTLIDAVALLRTRGLDTTLEVLGDGNARNVYERYARDLGVGDLVTFHGAASPTQLAAFYQRAAAFVLPSRFDSFPTVVLEAMACGAPVIASKVGGIPTFVNDEVNGLLVQPDQPEGIASAVQRLAADRAFAESLADAGRQTVEDWWTTKIQGRRTSEVLHTAMSTRAHRRSRSLPGKPALASRSGGRNLVIVTPYFPPFVGGVEQYTWHLARAMNETGRWNVTVLTTGKRGIRSTISMEDGVQVVRLGSWGRYSYTPMSPLWPWQMRRYIKILNPEVVNAHTPVPLLADVASWVRGPRLFLLSYHAGTLKKDAGPVFSVAERAYAQLERITFKRTDAVLAVSEFVKDALRDRFKGRLVIFPNAVSASSLSEIPAQPTGGQFVFVARLDKGHQWKGLELVIQAIALCPGASLKVAGDGDVRWFYEQCAHELGLADRVEFLGTVNGDDKDELIRTSSALIAYPTTSNDAFPTVLLEAWAVRTPVIAADLGALSSLVEDGVDGFLVAPSQPHELAKAMEYLMENPTAAVRCGEEGRNRMRHLTWEALAVRFEQLVDTIQADRLGARSGE